MKVNVICETTKEMFVFIKTLGWSVKINLFFPIIFSAGPKQQKSKLWTLGHKGAPHTQTPKKKKNRI